LAGTLDMKVNILENVCEVLSECRMMCGMEVRGLAGGWKEIVAIGSMFCKKIIGLPRFAGNSVAEQELRNSNKRGTWYTVIRFCCKREKVLCMIVKYWLYLIHKNS
jgi:hypothetical protein